MRKITLAIESLAVESFATMPGEGAGSTVVAHQRGDPTAFTACDQHTCVGTCLNTCPTCYNTCATCGTCPVNTCPSCFSCLTDCGGCGYVSQPPYFYSCRAC
ncbi:MAG TPA: hypothetical protein VFJ16_24255 [Longimicrobium sp.]|nr:hypothetical protein [Longimicrobium sp.]